MESNCDRCIHADSVSGYEDGQDMFVCAIEESLSDDEVELANDNKCPRYVCANEFEPCPMCGKGLTARDIIFADEEGYPIVDLDSVYDFEDLCNPINIEYDGEEDEEDRKRIEEYHNYKVDDIDHVYIACSCGFTFCSNIAYDFHNKKWFEEFKKEANRRADNVSDFYGGEQ